MPTLTERAIRDYLDQLLKPPGSLGRIEDLAVRLCLVQQTLRPRTRPRAAVLFAADHGVVAAGVSAWPSEVTGAMIGSVLDGGAACSVLARSTETALRLVDVGAISAGRDPSEGYRCAKVAAGTADLSRGPAMSPAQFEAALAEGRREAARLVENGIRVAAAGELGIGNSTAAACVAALLLDLPAEAVTGRGAGADDATLARKRAVVAEASARARPRLDADPQGAIAAVAGFELVALAGFYTEAAAAGLVLVLDGFIATASALIAETIRPGTAASMIAAHRSAEGGHDAMLAHLGLTPLLDWSMRLGEGSGAIAVMPLLDAAAAVVSEMATFESAGVPRG